MYKHRQRRFNFIREFVHFSEESRPEGGDINCLVRSVREWEWKLWKKAKQRQHVAVRCEALLIPIWESPFHISSRRNLPGLLWDYCTKQSVVVSVST
jgi:hypothetical protein